MKLEDIKKGQRVSYVMKISRKDRVHFEKVTAEVLNVTRLRNIRIRVGAYPKSTDVSVKPEHLTAI